MLGMRTPRHCFPETLLVHPWVQDSRLAIAYPEVSCLLHPAFKLLVPSVRAQEIDDANYDLLRRLVNADNETVIHDVRL